jgi:hypothetical protein
MPKNTILETQRRVADSGESPRIWNANILQHGELRFERIFEQMPPKLLKNSTKLIKRDISRV